MIMGFMYEPDDKLQIDNLSWAFWYKDPSDGHWINSLSSIPWESIQWQRPLLLVDYFREL